MSDLPDKGYLYGQFQKGQDWRDRLQRKLAHKAVDIGVDDDVNVDNSQRNSGFGWKELAVLATGGLGAMYMFSGVQPAPQAVPSENYAPLHDSEYEVRFFDKEGNLIKVPHISQIDESQQ